ncbi:MAG TPA: NADPH-dependent 7-cyano-7-deazaguanine reductase QueF [Spongiibacteraceae bacterium]
MSELTLGKSVDYNAVYNPGLLFPIARAPGRAALGLSSPLPFRGWDIWNAYELSWLNVHGKPEVACAEIWVPVNSPNIVESKSLKLYLNSLNQHRFIDSETVRATIAHDLAQCLNAAPEVHLRLPANWQLVAFAEPAGECIDAIDVAIEHYQPTPSLLRTQSGIVTERLFSHLLRSRCPVTGQPDWATVQIEYTGPAIDRAGLLAYIVSFRLHQDFHEHCVERIFVDLQRYCAPQQLAVYARYLRRGGLDINPYRSTGQEMPQPTHCFRQ